MESAQIGDMVPVSGISLGIVAAIMMGFTAGYLTNKFNKIKMPRALKPIMPLIIIPVCLTSILIFPFVFGLSGILGCAMNWFGAALG
jgi:PTS system fructose-specific IIC component